MTGGILVHSRQVEDKQFIPGMPNKETPVLLGPGVRVLSILSHPNHHCLVYLKQERRDIYGLEGIHLWVRMLVLEVPCGLSQVSGMAASLCSGVIQLLLSLPYLSASAPSPAASNDPDAPGGPGGFPLGAGFCSKE